MADGLFDKAKEMVDMRKRVYAQSLLKSFAGLQNNPISSSDFSQKELDALDSLIKEHYKQKLSYFSRPKKELLKEANLLEQSSKQEIDYAKSLSPDRQEMIDRANNKAQLYLTQANQLREASKGNIPTDFSFQYTGYGDRTSENKFTNDPLGWAQVLGRFRYKINPETGSYTVYDSYDFNNDVHKLRAENYAQMSPFDRFTSSVANTLLRGDQYALGEAYLSGKNSVPVEISRGKLQQVESPSYSDPFGSTINSTIR